MVYLMREILHGSVDLCFTDVVSLTITVLYTIRVIVLAN